MFSDLSIAQINLERANILKAGGESGALSIQTPCHSRGSGIRFKAHVQGVCGSEAAMRDRCSVRNLERSTALNGGRLPYYEVVAFGFFPQSGKSCP